MKISLITPCYQAGKYLSETIESVLSQDYADFEYWVIDGNSTDETKSIIKRYANDPRLHWISEPDNGQSHALTKGLGRCTGEIINWINADDLLAPGALSTVAKTFKRTKADVVSGYTLEFSESDDTRQNLLVLPLRRCAEQTISRGIFCQPSTFWRTEVVRQLGGVEAQLHYVMDWHLWVKYLALYGQSRVVRLREVFAHFRMHDASKTMTCPIGFQGEALTVFRKLIENLGAEDRIPFSEIELGGVPASIALPDFSFGPHFRGNRLLGFYCDRVTGRLYSQQRYDEAARWLQLGGEYYPRFSWWRLKMTLRLLLKCKNKSAIPQRLPVE